jgi:hypothetical protein
MGCFGAITNTGSALFMFSRKMRSLMMVIAPKHVGAVLMSILMSILKLFLRQFTCASVGE